MTKLIASLQTTISRN